uniref:carbonic anhydrase 15-like n=1 Tax=Callithrix jacchus TaxID=9483 RepID=UPI0023DD5604|nr:carbonic anhydrase 15-like [Callithrix jacchus]
MEIIGHSSPAGLTSAIVAYTQRSPGTSSGLSPTHWKKLAPACGGPDQYPINTDLHRGRWISTLGPFIFRGYNSAPPGPWTPDNDSHTGLLRMDTDPRNHVEIQGPGLLLPAYFTLLLHFHWEGLSMI